MASTGVATPLVVDVIERARPNFKKHPFKLMEDDPNGEFSSIPYGVLHVEDIRVYSHCNIEELGNTQMLKLYTNHMIDEMGNLKPEFKMLEKKGFTQFVNFPVFMNLSGFDIS